MSIFEWLCERYNPGPTGTLDRPQIAPLPWPNWLLLLIGAGLVIGEGYLYFTVGLSTDPTMGRFLKATLVFVAYHLFAYLIQPQPNYSNFGWLGGLIDHPFRISDDVNRFMLLLKVFLAPGLLPLRIWATLWRSGD